MAKCVKNWDCFLFRNFDENNLNHDQTPIHLGGYVLLLKLSQSSNLGRNQMLSFEMRLVGIFFIKRTLPIHHISTFSQILDNVMISSLKN